MAVFTMIMMMINDNVVRVEITPNSRTETKDTHTEHKKKAIKSIKSIHHLYSIHTITTKMVPKYSLARYSL